MSERKTAEFKCRVAPSKKAAWQALAAQENVSLSELVERAVESYAWELQNKRLDSVSLADNAIKACLGPSEPCGCPELTETESPVAIPITEVFPTVPDPDEEDAAPQEDVPTSDEVGANCERGCKPWEFCACKARSFEDGVTR